jgi:hypothetical protein
MDFMRCVLASGRFEDIILTHYLTKIVFLWGSHFIRKIAFIYTGTPQLILRVITF